MKSWKKELEPSFSSTGYLNTQSLHSSQLDKRHLSIRKKKAFYDPQSVRLSHCLISHNQYMPTANILTQSVLLFDSTRLTYYLCKKRNHIFFHLLSIKQSLPPASLHIRSTQQNKNTHSNLFFIVFLFYIFMLWVFLAISFPDTGFISSHPTTPSYTNNKSVSLGAKNWEPVCSTGDNTVRAPAINQIPSNQRWAAGGITTTAAD